MKTTPARKGELTKRSSKIEVTKRTSILNQTANLDFSSMDINDDLRRESKPGKKINLVHENRTVQNSMLGKSPLGSTTDRI